MLPKRLAKFGLEMHTGKSSIIPDITKPLELKEKTTLTNLSIPLPCYWGKSRRGFWSLRFTSRSDRFRAKLNGMKEFLRKNLTTSDTPGTLNKVTRVIKGWVNYHYISYNKRRVDSFLYQSKRILLRWFNRRGGKKQMTWSRFVTILDIIRFPRRVV